MISVQPAQKNQYHEITAFYQKVGYGAGFNSSDTVLEARNKGKLIGVTRLAEEKGVLVLRGMYVEEESRGQGLGRLMLDAAAAEIGSRECWCIPYAHLRQFYSRIGFQECTQELTPKFLRERASDYQKSGHRVLIMRREPWL